MFAPRINYSNYQVQLDPILDDFEENEEFDTGKLLMSFKMSPSTARGWKAQMSKDWSWRPYRVKAGQHRTIFGDDDICQVQDITRQFNDDHYFFGRSELKSYCKQHVTSAEYDNVNRLNLPKLSFANGTMKLIEKRSKLSLRSPHPKKRPNVTDQEIAIFKQTVHDVYSRYSVSNIYNMDETRVQCYEKQRKCLFEIGTDDTSIYVEADTHASFTATVAISADGDIIRDALTFLKTDAENESVFAAARNVVVDSTPAGWQTAESMKRWLKRFQCDVTKGKSSCLFLDSASVHRAKGVESFANDLGLEFIWIPDGMTDKFQPLDRRLFGPCKTSCRRRAEAILYHNPTMSFTKSLAAKIFQASLLNLKNELVLEAWDIFPLVHRDLCSVPTPPDVLLKEQHPNVYYYRYTLDKKVGPWTHEEDEILMAEVARADTPIQWGMLSRFVPGRCGYQCRNRHYYIKTINKKIEIY